MQKIGHFGFSILVLSLFLNYFTLAQILLIAAISILPDIDIKLRVKHRKYTHNITAALIPGLTMALIFYYHSLNPFKGFLIGFVGIVLHISADLLTFQKFPPLFPFSQKLVAFKIFRSNNKIINSLFFILGVVALTYFTTKKYILQGGILNLWLYLP
ncbi:hypothetical protein DRO97_07890 [Archaeoglobales archaeon]|nr:MAG: hypothetical protein DRO97_07890 [Archaeoglobales archaeon]